MRMEKSLTKKSTPYDALIQSVGELLDTARKNVFYQVNQVLVKTYWGVGRKIVDFEQKGREKADYGAQLLDRLSLDLKRRYGTGFSRSNLYLMRLFYVKYQKIQTVSGKLSWSHFAELLGVSNDLARGFYEKQCLAEGWTVRELKRQINSMLFERIASSKNKKEVLQLSRKGHFITSETDIVKDPYVLEFLRIPYQYKYSEKELEQTIIDNLQMFLLELGKGFTFVARQFRVTLNNTHYFIDLVFYHRILHCFVLIDLKVGKVNHQDIGQMNMYLNYFKKEEMHTGDNEPVGIILSADKDHLLVEYALGGISNKLFVSKYQLYLPSPEELEKELKKLI